MFIEPYQNNWFINASIAFSKVNFPNGYLITETETICLELKIYSYKLFYTCTFPNTHENENTQRGKKIQKQEVLARMWRI